MQPETSKLLSFIHRKIDERFKEDCEEHPDVPEKFVLTLILAEAFLNLAEKSGQLKMALDTFEDMKAKLQRELQQHLPKTT